MKLHELETTDGSKRNRFRKGRGIGSGNGKTAGKGHKGQHARSGGGTALGFEGGQMPIYRRLPKRGFHNYGHVEYAIVNVSELNRFDDGTLVTTARLVESGLVKKEFCGIKILGDGKLTKKLNVKAQKFSKSAEKAIIDAGGTIEVL
ncbi:MAG: 50S ribosomal protein L15 [Bacilli bacterium]|jgi:large subunit ribosomal protein L15